MAKQSTRLSPNRFCRASTLVFTFMLLMVQNVFAEWYKDYEAGVAAAKKNLCAQAVPKLQASLRQKPDEGANIKFYGMNFGDYFPHFYLARCYAQLQNYKAALAEAEAAEQQGQIQKKRDLWNQLNQIRTVAKAQLAISSAPKTAEVQPPAPKEASPQKTQPEAPKFKEPEPIPVKPVNPPPKAETEIAKQEPVKEIEPEPTPQAPQKSPEELAIEKATALVQSGGRKYFQGDYDSAILLLTAALNAKSDNLRAEFLLGCAYAAKYLLTGSEDQVLLKKASATFQKIKRISPDFSGKKSPYISPAILGIYERS